MNNNKNIIMQQNKIHQLPRIQNTFLTKEELQILVQFDFSESIRLDIIKDYLLLACYSGLSIQEIKNLRYESFYKITDSNSKEEYHVLLKGNKNHIKNVIISNAAFQLFYKYEWELPDITIQAIRRGIKQIGKIIYADETLPKEIRAKFKALSTDFSAPTFCRLFLNDNDSLHNVNKLFGIPLSDFLDTNTIPGIKPNELKV